ncbi:GntR family transcriptional regulator [Pseudolysinimonas kribbensis]|uniref:HTH-type transcriptional regulator YmfC n=1 Tax=Pseudolysinimonas kribbensis TaxID=433641 RepID=A0ABQ6K4P8_9MICO|nr:GntR family transcriptional regulator [Pseudolysinimonas kribbensis]GMA94696.1 putative HTH-type transcriptional regulator YmfC [Pseudolysinimonas kribbensis]
MSTPVTPSGRLTSGLDLPTRLANDLRQRLDDGEWGAGDKLPTESELCAHYGVSRATVRQALRSLGGDGLIVIRQGVGSFVSETALIRTGMQELKSITSTIAEMGLTPGMEYHHRVIRPATEEEAQRLRLDAGAEVLDIRRRILANGIVVAYSFDILPRWAFPADFSPDDLTGSVFGKLAEIGGPTPDWGTAQVHAVVSKDIAWDADGDDAPDLFVLLDQLQFDLEGRPFMHTRSYFVEGRFAFNVLRTTR